MEGKLDEPLPTPPSYILPDERGLGDGARLYSIQTLLSPPSSFSPSCEAQSPPTPVPPVTPAKPIFVSHETILRRRPGLTTCPSCQLQVTTRVTYRAGALAWGLCVTCVLFGLVLGCCVIPLVVDYFKDSYHTCPRCRRVLHVHKRACCD